jgi:HAE1 family hydrophobic/amphiphilic exporter-1
LLTFVATAWLFVTIPKGFFPEEDIGQITISTEAAEDISFPAMVRLQARVAELLRNDPAVATVNSFNGAGGSGGSQNVGRLFVNLKPRGERPPMKQVVENLRKKVREVAGISVYMRPIQNLQLGGRQSKAQYQYILQSVQAGRAERLGAAPAGADARRPDVPRRHERLAAERPAGVAEDRPRPRQHARRLDRRDPLGALQRVRRAPGVDIYTPADSYQVIMEVAPGAKQDESALNNIYVRSSTARLVPMSSFTTVQRSIGPTSINHVGQLQAVTVSFNLAPGTALGDATAKIEKYRDQIRMPSSIITSYGGDAAVFKSSQGSQAILIVSALLVIYVLLGVLYESYIHPLTILAGLPSAAVGALLTLRLFDQDLTLIATIGILLLIGIVKKNAIMMIDFALDAHATRAWRRPTRSARRASCASGRS